MNQKVAIVTGASRGIGKAIALQLAQQEYQVILLARDKEKLQKVADEINAFSHTAIYSIDLSKREEVDRCFNDILQKYKQIDLLVNNAGILYLGTSELDWEKLQSMIATNLVGAIYLANLAARKMKEQRSGYIVNISSIGGKENCSQLLGQFGGYAASKFGLSGYSEALYKELAEYGVKVSCIYPGPVKTDMTSRHSLDQELMIPAEDIAKGVSFLLGMSQNSAIKDLVIDCTSRVINSNNPAVGVLRE